MRNLIDAKRQVLAGKKILLFVQYFFGYEKKIAEKLRQFGAIVTLYDERSVTKPFEKALLKISPLLFQSKTEKYYDNILAREKGGAYDYILFVDCEMVSCNTLLKYRKIFSDAKFCLYLWDSLRNLGGVENKLKLFDFVSSFDRIDSNKANIHFRPLFFCDDYRNKRRISDNKYDIAFVGTIHSDRYAIIQKLKEIKPNFYVYAYLQSHFVYYYYWMTKKEFKGSKKSDFKFEKLSSKEISKIVDESRVILDIHHPMQTGLTMRTIEMIGMGKKIITTNSDMINYNFYNLNNVCVIDRTNPVVPDDFFESEYSEIPREIYDYYSIDRWVVDVLGVSDI